MTPPNAPRTDRGPRLRRWHTAPLVAALCAAAALPMPAMAQGGAPARAEALRPYTVNPGSLESVLTQFARQAGVLISFDADLVRGLESAGFQGHATVASGLAAVLGGHPLVAQSEGPSAWRIRAAHPGAKPSAESAAGQEATGVTLATVEVRAQSEQAKAQDLPFRSVGSRSHISRDRIEQFRGTSVGDIFQGTPGVLIGENRNSGGLDVNIRGMQGQGRVPVLVDGARQETTVYRGYAGVSSRSYIDPDLIGGIDIEKGPSMAAGGTGAVGGLVSMRTLNAEDIVRPGQTFGLRLRGSAIGNNSGSAVPVGTPAGMNVGGLMGGGVYRTDCVTPSLCSGEFDLNRVYGPSESMNRPDTFDFKGWAGSLALAKRFESADLVAAYAERQQGNYYAGKHGPAPTLDLSERYPRGFWTDVIPKMEGASRFRAEERIVNSNFASRTALLKGQLYMPDDQELELSFLRYQSEYGQLMPSQLQWFGQVRQSEDSTVTANTLTSRYHWNPTDNDLVDLRANLWLTNTRSANGLYNVHPLLNEILNVRVNERYRRVGADVSNAMRLNRWGSIKLEYGAAAQRETISSDEAVTADSGARAGQRNEVSLFTSVQWKPVDSLTLDAGIRHTRYASEDNKPLAVSAGSSACQDTDGDGACDTVYTPKSESSGSAPVVSAIWEPLQGLQFYGRYAEALRMPSLFETTAGFSVGTTLDASLKPEHAKNREIGINFLKDGVWRDGDKLRLKVAWFKNHTRDYLTRTIPNTWEDTSAGINAGLFRMRNIQRADFHGFELSGSYDLGLVFAELSGTRYNFIQTCHYGSYRRYQCTDYGIAASYINNMIPPRWHGSLMLGTRLFDRRLTMGVRGTFMGRRTPTPEFDDQTNTGGINFARPVLWHAYRIFDLFATYKVNERVSVDFNVDNATDRYYLDALSLGLVPAPGRSARLSVTVQF